MNTLIFLGILVGVGAAFIVQHLRLKRAQNTTEPDAQTTDERAELYRLGGEVETFVEKSAHPRELIDYPSFKKAVAILAKPDVSIETLRHYANGANWQLGCAALEVMAQDSERDIGPAAVLAQFSKFRPWHVYFALRYFARTVNRPPVGAPIAQAQYWWAENLVLPDGFRDYFVDRAEKGDSPTFGTTLDDASRADPEHIELLLSRIDHPTSAALRSELAAWRRLRIDRTLLNSIGRFWGEGLDELLLIEPVGWTARLNEAQAAIENSTPRSVVTVGEPLVGKTSFLKLLGQRLAGKGWTIFEASGAELMAGQMYIGQLEERVRQIVTELSAAKRVVWYVPDLLQIADSGTHQGQAASIFDQIMPALSAKRLIIMGEASPAGMMRLVQKRPATRGFIELYRLNPMSMAETTDLTARVAQRICESASIPIDPAALESVLHLTQQYLGSTHLPGTTLDLLKSSANQAIAGNADSVTVQHVFDTLSQATGLPRTILDDDQRMDLSEVRKFFAARVIGQDEAVSAMVDRIAMLKAGLTDPKRPIGVFLFAGPTGTGKTELAKTLAEYLFGSADRMTRLDMSEFQTADSTAKIVGTGNVGSSDALVDRVRKQPFSVVLLDEFEKAHPNAWDLFLQVFDDGRLSDANGREVDFRHTIIVLTSNIGAAAQRGSGIGFARTSSPHSEDNVLEAVGRTFRPEFVNRLDKIIVFRPLSRLLMRDILVKELRLVLERRGLKNRDWAVEWEDSAMEFLLDKGFSPEMGARPLRRAIDQYLLAPLAATLVEHRYPAGDQFLFVRSEGTAIEVEFVDPDRDDSSSANPQSDESGAAGLAGLTLATMILSPVGSDAEKAALATALAAIQAQLDSPLWREGKDSLLAETIGSDFWSRPNRFATFARLSLIDRVDEAARTAERLLARLRAASFKSGRASRDMVSRLALQLYLVRQGIADVEQSAPVDALLKVERALESGSDTADATDWVGRISAMYRGWAARRHMQLHEIRGRSQGDAVIFQIAGFGAFLMLAGEAGLHVLEQDGDQRIVARVSVAAGAVEDPPAAEAYRHFSTLLGKSTSGAVVRRYREAPAPLVRDSRQGWRSGRIDVVLRGDFDLLGEAGED